MVKTKWTRKKKKTKKTKPLKDITSPLKDNEIPKEIEKEKKNDANLVEDKEKEREINRDETETNPVEDKEKEIETNTNENEENETEERVEDEANEPNPNDVEENEEKLGEDEERSKQGEANLDENNLLGANVQSNEGGREEGSSNPTLNVERISSSLSLLFSFSRVNLLLKMEYGSGSSRRRPKSNRKLCSCALEATIYQAWTDKNPGRRFYGCPRYKEPNGCNFFSWFDKEDGTLWQKRALLEARDEIREKSLVIEQLKETIA
ncbi:hypothetical protein Bca52824_027505 [Brassica carinata]|uniref:GRF-type domain-containing protein n=1 Tax=Brassica carinata TaxID=52824 RepID=A0A8X7VAL8_BRACI|nr:hypothetical protein Bca52824_027505 [Brassica carinata]